MLPVVQLDFKGLYTLNNQLSQIPAGAAAIADNLVCDRPGVGETRRGFTFYGNALPSIGLKAFIYKNTLLWYCQGGQLVYDTGSGVWSTYSGSFFPPTNNFVNSTQASGNFYFTTNNGPYKLDSLTGTPRLAGVPAALDLTVVLAGVGTAIPTNSQVAYALIWTYLDANNNLILGAPSMFFNLTNTSGSTQNATITATLPSGITTSHIVQLYRTPNTGSSSVAPGNNLQLVLEYTPNGTDISNKFVTLTDTVPDSILGAALYTNDGQPNNTPNSVPPLALDICTYQGMTFYANFTTIQSANVTLDSVGAPNGLQINDTFAITDATSVTTRTYTGKAANAFASQQFKIDTSGTIAQNIDNTSRNLVAAINQDPSNSLFYAYYVSSETSLPGLIILTARTLQAGSFYVQCSRTTCWVPTVPSSGTTYTSSNNSSPNGIIVSKVGQPEACPTANLLSITTGQTSIQIYRIIALQDAVYAFTNGGVFRITGTSPSTLQVLLFDSSALLVGLQTPQILNNSIYYFSNQAVCSVSSGGNQIISRNIERDLLRVGALANFTSQAFGCSYESDRKFLLFCPTTAADTAATQEYVYNWITQAYTRWTRTATAAIVSPATGTLFIADALNNVFQERKNFSNTDYSDESYSITINSIGTGTFTLASSTNVVIGDIIQQTVSGTQWSTQVTGNNTSTGVVNVKVTANFTTGSATSYRSIASRLQLCPVTCGFAEYLKKHLDWQFMFDNANFTTLPVTFSTDIYPTGETVSIAPQIGNGWGVGGFGLLGFGVGVVPLQVISTWPTVNTTLAHWVTVDMALTQAFTSFSFNGLATTFNIISTRSH